MTSKKKKEPKWLHSKAKKLLLQDCSGAIPLDIESMAPKDAYLQRPEFAEFGYVNFPSHLRAACQQITGINN